MGTKGGLIKNKQIVYQFWPDRRPRRYRLFTGRGECEKSTRRPQTGNRRQEKDRNLRLSLYTDVSLRLLMYLASTEKGVWVKTPEVARAFMISVHHLQKAVQGLVRAGYVHALQGRSGGVRLAVEPSAVRLGAVVAQLEGIGCLIDCHRGPCPLAGRCILKRALDAAEHRFVSELDNFTLADVIAGQTGETLRKMIRVREGGADRASVT